MTLQKINSHSYVSTGETFLLAYIPSQKEIFYCGSHKGEISGSNIIVESYTSVDDIIKRVKELDLNLSKEQADGIIHRADLKSVTISNDNKTEIFEYVEKIKKSKMEK